MDDDQSCIDFAIDSQGRAVADTALLEDRDPPPQPVHPAAMVNHAEDSVFDGVNQACSAADQYYSGVMDDSLLVTDDLPGLTYEDELQLLREFAARDPFDSPAEGSHEAEADAGDGVFPVDVEA
ncbi:hypothetical protein E2562_035806 [Oryza meyeriana var. granulata]|uniref:Uncharacterized protein n=1 Tax=Oryza meyeriana var. granulata TaxID=110450 RepID=A0A6G1D9D2_9ORYZ|nr:hypothetical protein E2562_035806 [Oryza meyeriana var. granulata]